jgi:hypothetical protein
LRQLATVYGNATVEYAVLSDASSLASVRHGQRFQAHKHTRLTDDNFVQVRTASASGTPSSGDTDWPI